MKQKISLSNFLFQKQDQLLLELFINLQIKKVSRNTAKQSKLAQYVKRRMAYSRGSEYKLISQWFNIRRRKQEHNKEHK